MIEIENLEVRVGEFHIYIKELKMGQNDYLIIVGPTGAGKTILLETIAGFHTPLRGSIKLNGQEITSIPPHQRNISMVYQDYMLFPHMSVEENIAYPLKIRKIKDMSPVKKLARKLGIEHLLRRYPSTLSGGEMQRVALARAVIIKPKLLLLDEPFSALDPQMRDSARKIVKDFIEELKIPTIHVTHDFSDAWILGNKMGVMRNGKIVRFGDVNDVFSNPKDDFVAGFLGATNILRGLVIERDLVTKIKIGNKNLYTTDFAEKGQEVLISIRPENIVISKEVPHGSQRNVLQAKIMEITYQGHIVWIRMKSGDIYFKAMLTPNAVESMRLEKGMKIYASFKATATKIVRKI